MWHATVLTLFPEMFPGPLGSSLAGRALENHLWFLHTVYIREFATDKHRTVDDTPFGGGAGLVMKPDVIDAALRSFPSENRPFIYLTPRGKPLTQEKAVELSKGPGVVLLCGRYEGVDQRVIDAWNMEEISIGDYILSGGEMAALTLMDACVRLIPGVVGNEETHTQESFTNNLLEHPQYTRPAEWNGKNVPKVLLLGNHQHILRHHLKESMDITRQRRPDLWQKFIRQALEQGIGHNVKDVFNPQGIGESMSFSSLEDK